MMPIRWPGRRSAAAACALLLALSACKTSSLDKPTVYREPLRQSSTLEISAEDGSLSDGIDTYRLSDLEPGQRPADDTTEGGLWYIMDKAENKVRTSGNRITDPALNAYVQKTACKLAEEFCEDIRVYIVRMPAFNANMAPNGMMQVWSGFLLRAENEAQLASILGHEIGHYLRRHSVERIEDLRTKLSIAAVVGLVASGLTIGLGAPTEISIAASVGSLGVTLALLNEWMSYSRDQEREADGYGLLLMSEAGYDPREYGVVWDKLIQEFDASQNEEQKEKRRRGGFFNTHPRSEERREIAQQLGEELAATRESWALGRDAYLEQTLPHRAGFLRDELFAQNYAAMIARLDMMLALDGEPNPAELHFFKGESYRLRREKGDRKKALESYKTALDSLGTPPNEIYRSMGVLYNALKSKERAYNAFQRYLELEPDASDAELIREIMKSLPKAQKTTS